MCIVDNLLDILTGNEHRKTFGPIEEQKNIRLENELFDPVFQNIEPATATDFSHTVKEDPEQDRKNSFEENVDFESLSSLSHEGFDMSFLENLKQQYNKF